MAKETNLNVNPADFSKYMLCEDGFGNMMVEDSPLGYQFQLRIPITKGNYLSCLEYVSFALDGKEIPRNQIVFKLNDKRFSLDDLPELYAEFWYVLDRATILVYSAEALYGRHRIDGEIHMRFAYMDYNDTGCMVSVCKCSKEYDFGEKE